MSATSTGQPADAARSLRRLHDSWISAPSPPQRGGVAPSRSGKRGSPSSGIGSSGEAYLTNWWAWGRMPGSSSRQPRRTATRLGSSGLVVCVWLPHRSQKALAQPSPGSQTRILSCPAVTETVPDGARAVIERVVPDRRWQRRQWQYSAPRKKARCARHRTDTGRSWGRNRRTCSASYPHRAVDGVDTERTRYRFARRALAGSTLALCMGSSSPAARFADCRCQAKGASPTSARPPLKATVVRSRPQGAPQCANGHTAQ
jgi:hypothetical protein